MNKFNYTNLTPFKWFVLENFPFIEADFDALTEWQLFCKLGKEMNKIINSENTLGTQVENVTNAFIDLQNYVNNYFDNLDVQEEVNNKLNEMADSGELAELITQYLEIHAVIGFNTCSALSQTTNLANGSFARTLGRNQYNDGYGAFYKIRQKTNADTPDGYNIIVLTNTENLVAERILNQSIINLENEVEELKEPTKKYVFMGDSYADGYTPDGNVTSWMTLLVNKLNLTSGQYILTHQGGLKFAYSSSDYNYIKLLNALTSDNDLTDMYVCGGYNDIPSSENDIDLGIGNFNTLFKTKFPNAKLHIGFIGWSKNGSSIRKLSVTYKAYKKACDKYQIDFLDGCEYALHNYYKYFASDGIHPNQDGQNSIANALYDCITKGKANVIEIENFYFQPVSGSVANSNTRMILNNGIVTAIMNGGSLNSMSISFTDALTQTGNAPVKIADITNSLAVGTDYNDCLFQGVPCIVLDGSAYSTKVLDFIIKNSEMYVVNSGASGGNFQSITIKSIQIPSAMFSMSALNC